MVKSVKEFIYDTRADLKKSLKLEITAAVCIVVGSLLWFMMGNPGFTQAVASPFGPKNLILVTYLMIVFIFGLIGGSVTLIIMDVLMHYLRGKQVDLLIDGLEAQQAMKSKPPEVDEIILPKPKVQQQKPQVQVKKPAQAQQPQQVQRKPTPQRRDVPPARTPAPQKKTIIQRKPGR